MTIPEPVLTVRDLTVRFAGPSGLLTAVDRLSFSVAARETLALVGESGCGKSVTALALLRLLKSPPASISGEVLFEGENLLSLGQSRMRDLRGNRLAMIFQNPLSALNPVMRIGDQIAEVVTRHEGLSRRMAWRRAIELLDIVRLPEPKERVLDFPHRLSGGMRQRVMIAMALAGRPSLLIADEATTALDVTIQGQILKLLHGLQQEFGMALILISHDLASVSEMADRVIVMYAGRKMEEQPVAGFFARPLHPYSRGLMGARPVRGQHHQRLSEIRGMVPALTAIPTGCAFAPRCTLASDRCRVEVPPPTVFGAGAAVACFHAFDARPAEVA